MNKVEKIKALSLRLAEYLIKVTEEEAKADEGFMMSQGKVAFLSSPVEEQVESLSQEVKDRIIEEWLDKQTDYVNINNIDDDFLEEHNLVDDYIKSDDIDFDLLEERGIIDNSMLSDKGYIKDDDIDSDWLYNNVDDSTIEEAYKEVFSDYSYSLQVSAIHDLTD